MLRQILPITDVRLRTAAEVVTAFDADLDALAGDLLDTMTAAEGAGLAAVQIGDMRRVIAMTVRPDDGPPLSSSRDMHLRRVLINPVVVRASSETRVVKEGCLSMPGVYFDVERPAEVDVTFQDLVGREQAETFRGFTAVCVQHEIDHCNGVRSIDKVSPLKRAMLLKEFDKKRNRLGRGR